MQKLTGALFLLMSLACSLAGAAAVYAMVRAFTAEDTLAAVESAFGTLVVSIALLVMARLSLKAGMIRLGRGRRP